MNRALKIYIALLVLIIIGIIVVDANRPKPVNWTPTYATKDKIPFGLYVLDQEMDRLFPNKKIERFGSSLYEYLDPKFNTIDSTFAASGTLLLISESNEMDQTSLEELLRYVHQGNAAFLSMKDFPRKLMDTLKTDYGNKYYLADKLNFNLTNNAFKGKNYAFKKGVGLSYFNKIDTLNTTILGHQEIDTAKNINFIKVRYGKGSFLLHTQPAAFSNYTLLKTRNAEYCAGLLSHIPSKAILWQAKSFKDDTLSTSPMRYIFSQPALKWAWYFFLLGMITFMLFNAKRRQRVVPIKVPLVNTTVDFTKTIGNLYLQEGNHHIIIDKKIIYFLEKIRTDYLLDTFDLNETFVNRLHQKTGKDKAAIELVVRLIKRHRNELQSTEKDVIAITHAIEAIR